MTEREKMLGQMLYDADHDEELLQRRLRAKELCYRFNGLSPLEEEQQRALLRELLGRTGAQFCIMPSFWCDYGDQIEIGENFFSNHNLVILDCARVRFGDNVMVGPNCGFYTAQHPIDAALRRRGLEWAYPITVGDDVWFGGGVQVMPGVTIGSDVVIGGGSVVVSDIPSHSVAAGNPCRVIRPISGKDRHIGIE